jgi:hypothetical protein
MRDALLVDEIDDTEMATSEPLPGQNNRNSRRDHDAKVYILQYDAELEATKQAIEDTRAVIESLQSGT